MEKKFLFPTTHPPHVDGGEGSSANFATADEAYVHGAYPDVSFNSLLTYGSLFPAVETQFPLKKPKIEPFTSNDAVFPDASPTILSLDLPQNEAVIQPPAPNRQSPSIRRGGKQSRAKMSDKTKCLEKLLPCGNKMDIATVLETTYRYIQFLQAQVSALLSMPSATLGGGTSAASCDAASFGGGGGLEILNRQQLLQVTVNSQVAQSALSSNGCCVYAAEQLFQLNKDKDKDAETKARYEQMMYGSTNCPHFANS